MSSDLGRVIDQISRDKGIDRLILIETLEEAIKSAVKKKFGLADNFEVNFNEEFGEVEVFQFKEVVEKVTDDKLQIAVEDARQLDIESQIGDELGVKMDTEEFGRIAAQSAKQVIIQRMKDAERDIIYEDYKDRQGEIINGIVQRFDKGNIIVNLGRTDALLAISEQVPKENYRQGDRVRALILEVKQITRGPQIILSRTHPDFLKALFEMEVPEISESIVRIVAVTREPGSRSKIAVVSDDKDIDPVGACVGIRGSRVQSVVQELRGEKIDIIPYNPDPARFIVNALAPAVVTRVIVDELNRTMEVVVPDEQLSLAIGRKGQNVRLASKLSGWRIDVKNEIKYERMLKEGYQTLLNLPQIDEKMADALYEAGYTSVFDLLTSSPEELQQVPELDETNPEEIIEAARIYIDNAKIEEAEGDEEPAGDESVSAMDESAETTEEASEAAEDAEAAPPLTELSEGSSPSVEMPTQTTEESEKGLENKEESG
ncbi:MAG: transcription termination/antitermination protein NusA [Deltaproteobacteria bacterium]|nr:transcription termination/antitermination protein NusA [Deltaproteobacteria bacterium]MBW2084509.1 transcription termination/antitermination protein NusA [Deltaproteobacteria bacterium]